MRLIVFQILLLSGFLMSCSIGADHSKMIEQILGIKNAEYEEVQNFSDYGSPNGEGYSLSILKLQSTDIDEFLKRSETLSLIPKNGFKTINWTKTPAKDYPEVVELITNYHISEEQVIKSQEDLSKILNENRNCFFAGYLKSEDDYLYRVKFYVIEPSKGLLFIIDVEV